MADQEGTSVGVDESLTAHVTAILPSVMRSSVQFVNVSINVNVNQLFLVWLK